MKLLFLIVSLVSATAQDIFVPFFSGNGNHLAVNLLAYYQFEENAGDAAKDSSIWGRDLVVSGVAPILNPYQTGGILGNGKGYAGGDSNSADETDYYKRTDASFNFAGDFTIAGWVNGDWTGPGVISLPHFTVTSKGQFAVDLAWYVSFDKPDPNSISMSFWWSKNGTANFNVSTPAAGTQLGWMFFYVKREGGLISISYTPQGSASLVAATTVNNANSTGALFNSPSDLQVGNLAGAPGNDYRGTIDELGFWNRGLPDCELRWLYKQGSGTPTRTQFDALDCQNPALP